MNGYDKCHQLLNSEENSFFNNEEHQKNFKFLS